MEVTGGFVGRRKGKRVEAELIFDLELFGLFEIEGRENVVEVLILGGVELLEDGEDVVVEPLVFEEYGGKQDEQVVLISDGYPIAEVPLVQGCVSLVHELTDGVVVLHNFP